MKSNPMNMPKMLRPWTQGVTLDQMVAGGAGIWVTKFVANKFKPAPATNTDKLYRGVISFATALGAGVAGKAISQKAGQAAVIGGLAGTFLDALNMLGLLEGKGVGRVASRPRINAGTVVSPATSREGETVSIIRP